MSGERFTIDTNVLVYSVDDDFPVRRRIALDMLDLAVVRDCRLTLQAISEFFAVVRRKRLVSAAEAAAQASDWLDLFPTIAVSESALRAALVAGVEGRVSYWDGLLLAASAEAGCTAILTEDMADGATVLGVRVINPFGRTAMSRAAALLLHQKE